MREGGKFQVWERYPSAIHYEYHERRGISRIRMIETFVSFVIFVVNDIELSISGYPQESLQTD